MELNTQQPFTQETTLSIVSNLFAKIKGECRKTQTAVVSPRRDRERETETETDLNTERNNTDRQVRDSKAYTPVGLKLSTQMFSLPPR